MHLHVCVSLLISFRRFARISRTRCMHVNQGETSMYLFLTCSSHVNISFRFEKRCIATNDNQNYDIIHPMDTFNAVAIRSLSVFCIVCECIISSSSLSILHLCLRHFAQMPKIMWNSKWAKLFVICDIIICVECETRPRSVYVCSSALAAPSTFNRVQGAGIVAGCFSSMHSHFSHLIKPFVMLVSQTQMMKKKRKKWKEKNIYGVPFASTFEYFAQQHKYCNFAFIVQHVCDCPEYGYAISHTTPNGYAFISLPNNIPSSDVSH